MTAKAESQTARNERIEREQQLELNDMREVLKLPAGRRLLWRAMSRAKVFTASYVANSDATAFHEGQRDIGLWLLLKAEEADNGAFAQLMKENKTDG